MRISDWSSDVCSSDLTMVNAVTNLDSAPDVMLFGDSMTQQGVDPEVLGKELAKEAGSEVVAFNGASSRARWGDRKSVVEGQSVSVRVDLGGRRIIKNKRERQTM